MSTELAPMADIQTRLRDKVREELGKLIPDEVLDKFVARAWTELVEGRDFEECTHGHKLATQNRWKRDNRQCDEGHNLVQRVPELVTMIKDAMRVMLKERVQAWAEAFAKGPEMDGVAKDAFAAASGAAGDHLWDRLKREAVSDAVMSLASNYGFCPNCRIGVPKQSNCPRCNTWVA